MARAKAIQILRDLNNGDTTFETLKNTQDRKYTYENLFYGIIEHKRKNGKKESYLKKVVIRHQKYFYHPLEKWM